MSLIFKRSNKILILKEIAKMSNCNLCEENKSFKKFLVIWFGQFISILGSGLSSFGLSVWIFYETGSATPFALSFLCTTIPIIIFAPIAGSFADRKKRKYIIMITDTLDAILKVIMVVLLLLQIMKVWMVYPILFISSTLSTFQGPAFSASIPMIVSKNKLSRANGMIQFSRAAQNMLAPVFAGALYPILNLSGLLVIDFISFFFAIATIAVIKIPQHKVNKENLSFFNTVIRDFKFAWNYLYEKKGFIGLLFSFSGLNFIAITSLILLGPMILANYNASIYGTIEAVYGFSMILGGVLSGILPNTNKKIRTIFMALGFSGIGLIIAGSSPRWYVIGSGFFIFALLVPYANTLLDTLFQSKIEPSVLGRVSALVSAILSSVTPIACMLAGPLADDIFEPLMSEGGILGNSFIGNLIGYGTGRGIGFLFILCGIILILSCILMIFNKNANTLEERIPDVSD